MKKIISVFIIIFLLAYGAIQWLKVNNDNFPFTKMDYSSWNPSLKKKFEAGTEVQLLQNILSFQGSDGDFRGTIRQYKDENNNLVILIRNNYTGDDSMGPFEEKFIAKRQNNIYKIVEFSQRISCYRTLSFLSFFIDPLWTTGPCP